MNCATRVVDDARNRMPVPKVRRSDPRLQSLRWPEQHLLIEAERSVDRARDECIKGLTTHMPNDLAQENGIEIGVDHARSGRCHRHRRQDHPQRGRAIGRLAQWERRAQTRRVCQEMPHRDARRTRTIERGEVVHDRTIEGDFPLFDQQHERRRRCHDLRQRRNIPERAVDTHRRTRRTPCQAAVALREQARVVPPHDERGAGVDAASDSGLHDRIEDRVER